MIEKVKSFENSKVGDKFFCHYQPTDRWMVVTLSRFTKNYAVIASEKYRIKTGKGIRGTCWDIYPINRNTLEAVRNSESIAHRREALISMKVYKLSDEQVNKIYEIFMEMEA